VALPARLFVMFDFDFTIALLLACAPGPGTGSPARAAATLISRAAIAVAIDKVFTSHPPQTFEAFPCLFPTDARLPRISSPQHEKARHGAGLSQTVVIATIHGPAVQVYVLGQGLQWENPGPTGVAYPSCSSFIRMRATSGETSNVVAIPVKLFTPSRNFSRTSGAGMRIVAAYEFACVSIGSF
jgi:hypothetical protein